MSDNSPAPGTPQTSTKAVVASVFSGVSTAVALWIADTPPVTSKEVVGWIIAGVVASGLAGGATYATKNKAKGLNHVGGGQ